MAKSMAIIVLSAAVCFLAVLSTGESRRQHQNSLHVEGTVYCDTCRAQFMTRLSTAMAGATVRLECKESLTGKVTLAKEAVTDGAGKYAVELEGDREDEICNVVLVKSSDRDCDEIDGSSFADPAARVSATRNNGIVSPVRTANPLGFLRREPLKECVGVFKELGLTADGKAILQQ